MRLVRKRPVRRLSGRSWLAVPVRRRPARRLSGRRPWRRPSGRRRTARRQPARGKPESRRPESAEPPGKAAPRNAEQPRPARPVQRPVEQGSKEQQTRGRRPGQGERRRPQNQRGGLPAGLQPLHPEDRARRAQRQQRQHGQSSRRQPGGESGRDFPRWTAVENGLTFRPRVPSKRPRPELQLAVGGVPPRSVVRGDSVK